MKDLFKVVVVLFLVILLVVSLWFGYLKLLRPALDLRRQAIQSSQQYTESKQSMLMQLVDDYHTAETEEHKQAVFERIKMESERINYDLLPESVKQILRRAN